MTAGTARAGDVAGVHHVLRASLPAVAGTLARAFHDDPLTRWILGDGDGYEDRLDRWMGFAVETGLAHGHLYASRDHAAVAIWAAPDASLFEGAWGQQMVEMLRAMLGDDALPRLKALAEATATGQPQEPHFYLFLIGSHPDARGRGLAHALLEPILARCDAEGLAAHLESSNPRNVPYYERHGFEIMAEVRPAPDGPPLHPMRRAPR